MPRTLPETKMTVASMPCLSKIFASLATQRTEDEPGVVEIYEVFNLSAAGARGAANQKKPIAYTATRWLNFRFIDDLRKAQEPHSVIAARRKDFDGIRFGLI